MSTSSLSTSQMSNENLRRRIFYNQLKDKGFRVLAVFTLVVSLGILTLLVCDLFQNGWARISKDFLISFPSRFPAQAGVLSAWVGTFAVLLVTAAAAIPIGIAAGIYLEEYAKRNWLTSLIELNIANLAGVPSILFGLLALGFFVYKLGLGQSILTAGLTLGLLILPIIIVATREALRSVPSTVREAAYALGATKWRTVKDHVMPSASGGILTGIIIALSRAIGETAPLVTIGALTFIAFLPRAVFSSTFPYLSFAWLQDPFTVMPIQIFNWISRPQEEFHVNAAAAGILLLVMTLGMNFFAIVLRVYLRRRTRW